MVATKVLASPQGTAPFYRIAEVYFPSMQALEECSASDGGKETLAHDVKISSGGPPIFLVAEEETFAFTKHLRALLFLINFQAVKQMANLTGKVAIVTVAFGTR
jgi:hypothetical protein